MDGYRYACRTSSSATDSVPNRAVPAWGRRTRSGRVVWRRRITPGPLDRQRRSVPGSSQDRSQGGRPRHGVPVQAGSLDQATTLPSGPRLGGEAVAPRRSRDGPTQSAIRALGAHAYSLIHAGPRVSGDARSSVSSRGLHPPGDGCHVSSPGEWTKHHRSTRTEWAALGMVLARSRRVSFAVRSGGCATPAADPLVGASPHCRASNVGSSRRKFRGAARGIAAAGYGVIRERSCESRGARARQSGAARPAPRAGRRARVRDRAPHRAAGSGS